MARTPKKREGYSQTKGDGGERAGIGRRIRRRVGKKMDAARKLLDGQKEYSLDEAIELLKKPELNFAKFDQSVDVSIQLGVDPRKSDQMVRGTVVLPHGTGKTARVVVFAKGEKAKEAEAAGADVVGADELIEKIQNEGWLDFDKAIATPDMMAKVARVAKVLGPRGLMPSPKVGTVTNDVTDAVKELKAGRVEFRVNKQGVLHAAVGKASFGSDQLRQNISTLFDTVVRAKPQTSKGVYLQKASLSLTQSPGVRLDVSSVQSASRDS